MRGEKRIRPISRRYSSNVQTAMVGAAARLHLKRPSASMPIGWQLAAACIMGGGLRHSLRDRHAGAPGATDTSSSRSSACAGCPNGNARNRETGASVFSMTSLGNGFINESGRGPARHGNSRSLCLQVDSSTMVASPPTTSRAGSSATLPGVGSMPSCALGLRFTFGGLWSDRAAASMPRDEARRLRGDGERFVGRGTVRVRSRLHGSAVRGLRPPQHDRCGVGCQRADHHDVAEPARPVHGDAVQLSAMTITPFAEAA